MKVGSRIFANGFADTRLDGPTQVGERSLPQEAGCHVGEPAFVPATTESALELDACVSVHRVTEAAFGFTEKRLEFRLRGVKGATLV